MPLDDDQVMHLARQLWQAEQSRQPVPTLSSSHPDLNEADAYRISAAKLALRHRKKTGYKLGYTSEAMPVHGQHDAASVLDATPVYMPALEVCDTRYLTYQFKAVDNISDNSSAARYVLGPAAPINADTDLKALQITLFIDDVCIDKGVGKNALEDPLLAVAWLANRLSQTGEGLNAGDVVLTGGLTKGYLVKQGQTVRNQIEGKAAVAVRFV